MAKTKNKLTTTDLIDDTTGSPRMRPHAFLTMALFVLGCRHQPPVAEAVTFRHIASVTATRPPTSQWRADVSRAFAEDLVGPVAMADCENYLGDGWTACTTKVGCVELYVFAADSIQASIPGDASCLRDSAEPSHWLVSKATASDEVVRLPVRATADDPLDAVLFRRSESAKPD